MEPIVEIVEKLQCGLAAEKSVRVSKSFRAENLSNNWLISSRPDDWWFKRVCNKKKHSTSLLPAGRQLHWLCQCRAQHIAQLQKLCMFTTKKKCSYTGAVLLEPKILHCWKRCTCACLHLKKMQLHRCCASRAQNITQSDWFHNSI